LEQVKGVKILPAAFFNEFAVQLPKPAADVVEALAKRSILGGVPAARFYPTYPELAHTLLLAATEMNSDAEIEALVGALKEVLS
jgi:glycine dehydrogenase subunit 1